MQLATEMRQCAAQLRRLFASPQPHGFNGARFESCSGWSRKKAGWPHLLIIIYVPLLSLQMQEGCSKGTDSKAQAAIPTLLSVRNVTLLSRPAQCPKKWGTSAEGPPPEPTAGGDTVSQPCPLPPPPLLPRQELPSIRQPQHLAAH